MIALNHNLMATRTSNELSGHYGRLQTSTERLSSGLRINSAADDAAGLAIRELMRADIAALNQGTRNANDAISMLQTFDGALGIIDEKLIRMKELAEQAATGTYDSTQRLMIDSEFQQMASEINRIANATDFNGVKLLCTPMKTWVTYEDKFVVTSTVSTPTLSGGQTPTVEKNINAENLVNEANPAKTISVNLTATDKGRDTTKGKLDVGTPDAAGKIPYQLGDTEFTIAWVNVNGQADSQLISYDPSSDLPDRYLFNGWFIKDAEGATVPYQIQGGFTPDEVTSRSPDNSTTLYFYLDDANGPVNFNSFAADHPDIAKIEIDRGNNTYLIERKIPAINADTDDYTATYNHATQTVTVNLKNSGGSVTLKLDNPLAAGDTISFDIKMEGEVQTVPVEHRAPDPDQKVKIHFGTMNDSAEDYYYISFENATTEGLGLDGVEIKTQDQAQEALVQIDDAIVAKDKIRAKYGALQNRFENTVSNLRIQAENLQAAESRISDTDVAIEMTMFVRNQILTQSAVAMLAQANSMPQLVMKLVG